MMTLLQKYQRMHIVMSNQLVDCCVDSCPSSAIKMSLLYQHVGLFTQHDVLGEAL